MIGLQNVSEISEVVFKHFHKIGPITYQILKKIHILPKLRKKSLADLCFSCIIKGFILVYI